MTTDLNVNMVWNVTEKILSTEKSTNIAGQRDRPKERPKKRLLRRKKPKVMMTILMILLLMTVKMTLMTSLMTKNLLKNGLQMMMMNDYEYMQVLFPKIGTQEFQINEQVYQMMKKIPSILFSTDKRKTPPIFPFSFDKFNKHSHLSTYKFIWNCTSIRNSRVCILCKLNMCKDPIHWVLTLSLCELY